MPVEFRVWYCDTKKALFCYVLVILYMKSQSEKYVPAADAGDGALYWCCSIFTAAAAPSAPAAALYC